MARVVLGSIGQRLTAAIGSTIALGFALAVWFYTRQHEKNTLFQNERTVHQIIESVREGLRSVMITGSTDVAQLFAEKLKGVRGSLRRPSRAPGPGACRSRSRRHLEPGRAAERRGPNVPPGRLREKHHRANRPPASAR